MQLQSSATMYTCLACNYIHGISISPNVQRRLCLWAGALAHLTWGGKWQERGAALSLAFFGCVVPPASFTEKNAVPSFV